MGDQKTSINSEILSIANEAKLPFAVYVLGFGIFAMVTSEFQVSGMITVMAADLEVTISQVGYLVSVYAFAMAFGGPVLAIALLRMPPKRSLMILFVIFIGGESIGAVGPSYPALAAARLMTGAASGAFFGAALAICAHLVAAQQRGWATSMVLAGIMVGTVLGLPLANLIGAHFGWRVSFWVTAGLATVAALVSMKSIPFIPPPATINLRSEITALKNPGLLAAFSTSLLIIGATFAAFTYFIPILKNVSGFSDTIVAALLFIYGAATVTGNTVVGKLADRYTILTLTAGLAMLTTFLTLFAVFADNKAVSVLSLVGIGLVGVTMNPAMVARVMRAANDRPLVNTIHTSVITLGIVIGAFSGGLCISLGYGPRSPLWVGVSMALLGLVTLLPYFRPGADQNRERV